jgi:MFS family permease
MLTLAMGVRHGFGSWLQPISQAHGWTRETYSLALALQNLMWGALGPFAGMAADRFGTARVVIVGAPLYISGRIGMALIADPTLFVIGSGLLIGGALACTTFGAVSGIVGRSTPDSKRSWAFGISSAASSFGQFMMMPIEQQLISSAGWQGAFHVLAALTALMMLPILLAPLTLMSVYVFAAVIGLLWLSTVPLTNGVIAGIFGVKYLSMLSGFVFLSHQVGSFLSVWLGGHLLTKQVNYITVLAITIALGIFAALINFPINEKAITREHEVHA